MRRFFTEQKNIIEKKAYIIDDASHITRTLRMLPGDDIIVFDGSGTDYICKLTEVKKDMCVADIISSESSSCEPEIKVIIFQALPKSGKMDGIIQKSVELGVFKIVPVNTARCVARFNDKKRQVEKVGRWNKISLEAAKQCGRGIVPEITEPMEFETAVSEILKSDIAVMPYEVLGHSGDKSLKKVLKNDFDSIGILIGPEGGFTDAEAMLASERGIKQIGLGKRILRTETVSSAVISMIMYEKNQI